MCLTVSQTRNRGRTKVYKVLYSSESGKTIESPFVGKRYYLGKWANSDFREPQPNYFIGVSASKGIHVFTSKKAAKSYLCDNRILVECLVNPEDWLADGLRGHALYRKILPQTIIVNRKNIS